MQLVKHVGNFGKASPPYFLNGHLVEVDSYEFDTANATQILVFKRTNTKAVICYRDSGSDLKISKLDINQYSGEITHDLTQVKTTDTLNYISSFLHDEDTIVTIRTSGSVCSAETFDLSTAITSLATATAIQSSPELKEVFGRKGAEYIADGYFLMCWSSTTSGNSYAEIIAYNASDGSFTRPMSEVTIETGITGEDWFVLKMSNSKALAFYAETSSVDGFVMILDYDTSTPSITKQGSTFEYDTARGDEMWAERIDDTHFALSNRSAGSDGFLRIFEVDYGSNTFTELDEREFDIVKGGFNGGVLIEGRYFANFWQGESNDGFGSIFDLGGNVITALNGVAYELDVSNNLWNAVDRIDNYLLGWAYSGPGNDGFFKTIYTDYSKELYDTFTEVEVVRTFTANAPAEGIYLEGDYILIWRETTSTTWALGLYSIDTGLQSVSVELSTVTSLPGEPKLTKLQDGYVVVTYIDINGGSRDPKIRLLEYDTVGETISWTGSEASLGTHTSLTAPIPQVAVINDTKILVAFEQDPSGDETLIEYYTINTSTGAFTQAGSTFTTALSSVNMFRLYVNEAKDKALLVYQEDTPDSIELQIYDIDESANSVSALGSAYEIVSSADAKDYGWESVFMGDNGLVVMYSKASNNNMHSTTVIPNYVSGGVHYSSGEEGSYDTGTGTEIRVSKVSDRNFIAGWNLTESFFFQSFPDIGKTVQVDSETHSLGQVHYGACEGPDGYAVVFHRAGSSSTSTRMSLYSLDLYPSLL